MRLPQLNEQEVCERIREGNIGIAGYANPDKCVVKLTRLARISAVLQAASPLRREEGRARGQILLALAVRNSFLYL